MTGYTNTIRRYAADNSHVGWLEKADGTGEIGLSRSEVGTRLAVRFALKMAGHSVDQIRFQVFGCGFTIAACAAVSEIAVGRPLEDVQALTAATIDRTLGGLPEDRSYCADLANRALQAAISSVCNGARPVRADLDFDAQETEDHGPRISPHDPLYRALMATPCSPGVVEEDRRLLAGLLTVASREPGPLTAALGLDEDVLDAVFATCFPGIDRSLLKTDAVNGPASTPDISRDVLELLLAHVPVDATGLRQHMAEWLAQIIAARTAQPGHLWVAMGLFERSQLTATIHRHLPTLEAANSQGMRWKRYLFKQVCESQGGSLCKSPNCGDCSDYVLCFAPEAEE